MKSDLAARLEELAAREETVTYGALARELGLRMAELTAQLEALMEEDAATGHPFRASLMDARLTPGLPAEGFFAKAMELGRPVPRSTAAIKAERGAVRAALGATHPTKG